jgi:hypothetical protein
MVMARYDVVMLSGRRLHVRYLPIYVVMGLVVVALNDCRAQFAYVTNKSTSEPGILVLIAHNPDAPKTTETPED